MTDPTERERWRRAWELCDEAESVAPDDLDGWLRARHLSPRILRAAPAEEAEDAAADLALSGSGTLKDRVERMEARILRDALTRAGWNKSRAAEELGLSRVGLRAKLERYGIEPPLRAVGPAAE